jgi:hypothetical protein
VEVDRETEDDDIAAVLGMLRDGSLTDGLFEARPRRNLERARLTPVAA